MQIFSKLAEVDKSNTLLSQILSQLNAYSSKAVEAYDFEARMDGFNAIRSAVKASPPTLTATQLAPVLHNLLFFLSDDDMAVRSQTAVTLAAVLKAVSEALLVRIISFA